MNVLIISANRSAVPTPVLPAGACLVAEAAERAGHSVTLLDLMFEKRPVRAVEKAILETRPHVVGVSVRNIDNNDMHGTKFYIKEVIALVETIRANSNAPVILGGAALTVMPEQIMRAAHIDCAAIGEGEAVFCGILKKVAAHQTYHDIPGVAAISRGIFKATPSPLIANQCSFPEYQRWVDVRAYQAQMSTIPLQTKLGCQFQCIYCTYRKIEGEAYRLFEPGCIAEAAGRLASSGLRDIEFVDNVFNAPVDHALEVCESLVRSGVHARFQSVELNPAYFSSELLTVMEKAGFVGMGLTVESASDPVLRGLQKGFTARDVFKAADIVQKHRIPCIWIFMLGGPGETRDTVRGTLRFAEKNIRPDDAAFFNIGIRIYPGTELETIARRQGVLTVPPGKMLDPVFYVSPGLDAAWIRSQVRNSMNSHMNFMSVDSFSVPYLPRINRIGYRLGIRSPLWRYTHFIRKGLRLFGMNV